MPTARDITVRVLDGDRRAEITIPEGTDPAAVTPALLATVAREAKVHLTADVARRLAEAANDYRANPRALTAEIARAVEPTAGTPGGWTWEAAFDPSRVSVTSEDRVTSTDHHASRIRTVATGDVVARFAPSLRGTDGCSVTGKAIPAPMPPAPELRPGKGLHLRSDGAVVATESGVLRIDREGVSIVALLELPGCVDFSSGNVEFSGEVIVRDSIRDGFRVRTGGNLTVHGTIEGADVRVGGSLVCQRGVASARRAEIRVRGDLTTGYLRNVRAEVLGALACKGEVEHSSVSVHGECRCESARVIGGSLALAAGATIGTLGSPDWIPTLVRIGELPLVSSELRTLTAEQARAQQELTKIDEHVRMLGARVSAPSARERLTELQFERSEVQRRLTEIDARRAELQEMLRSARKSTLVVAREVYPKVRVQHEDAAFEFDTCVKGPARFVIDEHGTILVQIASMAPRPIRDFAKSVRPTAADDGAPPARAAA